MFTLLLIDTVLLIAVPLWALWSVLRRSRRGIDLSMLSQAVPPQPPKDLAVAGHPVTLWIARNGLIAGLLALGLAEGQLIPAWAALAVTGTFLMSLRAITAERWRINTRLYWRLAELDAERLDRQAR